MVRWLIRMVLMDFGGTEQSVAGKGLRGWQIKIFELRDFPLIEGCGKAFLARGSSIEKSGEFRGRLHSFLP